MGEFQLSCPSLIFAPLSPQFLCLPRKSLKRTKGGRQMRTEMVWAPADPHLTSSLLLGGPQLIITEDFLQLCIRQVVLCPLCWKAYYCEPPAGRVNCTNGLFYNLITNENLLEKNISLDHIGLIRVKILMVS